jgi:hypothetical protein
MTLVTLVFHPPRSSSHGSEMGGGGFSPLAVLLVFPLASVRAWARRREREKYVCECACRKGVGATSKTTTSVYDVTLRSFVGRSVYSTSVVHLAGVVAFSQIAFWK